MKSVVVTGGFDDLRFEDIRFLEEAGKFGNLGVLLWSDDSIRLVTGKEPKFPQKERQYMLEAIRYVHGVTLITEAIEPDAIPKSLEIQPQVWVVDAQSSSPAKKAYCQAGGCQYKVLAEKDLQGFGDYRLSLPAKTSQRKRVVVTGCFDWFHSGHVRFLEEVSQLGDLYVVVGHDRNIAELKGPGHPMFPQQQRRYVLGSIKYVRGAMISTGHGWMDAEPEILRIKADIYAVNEDGDKPEKRRFCEKHGIEYVVLKRLPKEGLQRRDSTILRGF